MMNEDKIRPHYVMFTPESFSSQMLFTSALISAVFRFLQRANKINLYYTIITFMPAESRLWH